MSVCHSDHCSETMNCNARHAAKVNARFQGTPVVTGRNGHGINPIHMPLLWVAPASQWQTDVPQQPPAEPETPGVEMLNRNETLPIFVADAQNTCTFLAGLQPGATLYDGVDRITPMASRQQW